MTRFRQAALESFRVPFGFLLILCLLSGSSRLLADTICDVCGQPSAGQMYWFTDRARSVRHLVCERCARLPTQCHTCGLPIFKGGVTFTDGRMLCEEDARTAVQDLGTAEGIYADVKRDLFAMLNDLGVLPDRNIKLQLVDQKELRRIFSSTPNAHPDLSLQGVTRTRRYSKEGLEHEIYLCIGLSRARTAAVAAHEYTHAWIAENVPTERHLEGDIVEAFCELVAYQLMQQRGEADEVRAILQNQYTRGKIDILVKATDHFRFHNVAKWMKSGLDSDLESSKVDRVIALKDPPEERFTFLPVVHARAPQTLTLKGLSGSPRRRYALINDATLSEGEEGKVRLGETNVVLRCESIRDDAVTVRIKGSPSTIELKIAESRQ